MGFAWKRRGEGLSERSADSSVLLTPSSSAHPHLLNLNQGWAAQPFISLVSRGCLFHLTSSRGQHPFFSDPSSLSQSKTLSGTRKGQTAGRKHHEGCSNNPPPSHPAAFLKPVQTFEVFQLSVFLLDCQSAQHFLENYLWQKK